MTSIPGLVKDAYHAGSRHPAGTPALIKSDIDGNEFNFAWKASGSSVYSVIAKGSLVVVDYDSNGRPKFDYNKFHVTCSCPDGERQHQQSMVVAATRATNTCPSVAKGCCSPCASNYNAL